MLFKSSNQIPHVWKLNKYEYLYFEKVYRTLYLLFFLTRQQSCFSTQRPHPTCAAVRRSGAAPQYTQDIVFAVRLLTGDLCGLQHRGHPGSQRRSRLNICLHSSRWLTLLAPSMSCQCGQWLIYCASSDWRRHLTGTMSSTGKMSIMFVSLATMSMLQHDQQLLQPGFVFKSFQCVSVAVLNRSVGALSHLTYIFICITATLHSVKSTTAEPLNALMKAAETGATRIYAMLQLSLRSSGVKTQFQICPRVMWVNQTGHRNAHSGVWWLFSSCCSAVTPALQRHGCAVQQAWLLVGCCLCP